MLKSTRKPTPLRGLSLLLLPWTPEVYTSGQSLTGSLGASPPLPAGGRLVHRQILASVRPQQPVWAERDTIFKNETLNPTQAADTPQPPVKIAPETVFDQLHTLRDQIEAELSPLNDDQRRVVKKRSQRQTNEILQSSINIIGVADIVSQAVGMPADQVHGRAEAHPVIYYVRSHP